LAVVYADIGKEYPATVKGRPVLWWLDLFALHHEWQWCSRDCGNYIRNDNINMLEESELIYSIFRIIKNEKMRIFFKEQGKMKHK
jgi:hypothetical protein